MLDLLKLSPEVEVEEDKDTLGGYAPLPTDVYAAICEYLYIDQTAKGAVMAYGSFKVGEKSVRFSECIMSKKSGTLKATSTNKKTGKEQLLPGYSKVVHLAKALGYDIKDLSELMAEPKILKLYDFDARKELPVEKSVITDFTGKPLQVALYHLIETKMAKDAKGDYTVPTVDERVSNEIVKWFTEDGQTIEELASKSPAEFKDKWLEAHKGKVKDKRVKGAPTSGAPTGATSSTPKLKFD